MTNEFTPRVVYAGDGSTTEFAVTFPVDRAADIIVELVLEDGSAQRMLLNKTHTYRDSDSTMVMRTAPPSGSLLVIRRGMLFLQPSGRTTMSPRVFRSRVDSLTRIYQQLQEQLERTLHIGQEYPALYRVTEVYPATPANYQFTVTVDGENPVLGYHPLGTGFGAIDPDPPVMGAVTIDRLYSSGSSFRVRFIGGATMPAEISTITVTTANYGDVVVDAQNPSSIVSGEYRWSGTPAWELADIFEDRLVVFSG